MKVLIGCERSGILRDAFLARGHNAWSCDLYPSRRPGPHLQCDVLDAIEDWWDLAILHPVCKYLTNAGVRWLHEREGRWEAMREAAQFFVKLDRCKIPKRAVENPVMHRYGLEIIGRKATQFIHPWMFNSPFQKATGLWLTSLPKLVPEKKKSDYAPGEIKQKVWLMPPGPDREEMRSETDPGIARAMAEQWG